MREETLALAREFATGIHETYCPIIPQLGHPCLEDGWIEANYDRISAGISVYLGCCNKEPKPTPAEVYDEFVEIHRIYVEEIASAIKEAVQVEECTQSHIDMAKEVLLIIRPCLMTEGDCGTVTLTEKDKDEIYDIVRTKYAGASITYISHVIEATQTMLKYIADQLGYVEKEQKPKEEKVLPKEMIDKVNQALLGNSSSPKISVNTEEDSVVNNLLEQYRTDRIFAEEGKRRNLEAAGLADLLPPLTEDDVKRNFIKLWESEVNKMRFALLAGHSYIPGYVNAEYGFLREPIRPAWIADLTTFMGEYLNRAGISIGARMKYGEGVDVPQTDFYNHSIVYTEEEVEEAKYDFFDLTYIGGDGCDEMTFDVIKDPWGNLIPRFYTNVRIVQETFPTYKVQLVMDDDPALRDPFVDRVALERTRREQLKDYIRSKIPGMRFGYNHLQVWLGFDKWGRPRYELLSNLTDDDIVEAELAFMDQRYSYYMMRWQLYADHIECSDEEYYNPIYDQYIAFVNAKRDYLTGRVIPESEKKHKHNFEKRMIKLSFLNGGIDGSLAHVVNEEYKRKCDERREYMDWIYLKDVTIDINLTSYTQSQIQAACEEVMAEKTHILRNVESSSDEKLKESIRKLLDQDENVLTDETGFNIIDKSMLSQKIDQFNVSVKDAFDKDVETFKEWVIRGSGEMDPFKKMIKEMAKKIKGKTWAEAKKSLNFDEAKKAKIRIGRTTGVRKENTGSIHTPEQEMNQLINRWLG